VSAAVINLTIALGDMVDPERLMADAEAAVNAAKHDGRNRVRRVDGYTGVQAQRPTAGV
jgi:GGDEF domain-containing protein